MVVFQREKKQMFIIALLKEIKNLLLKFIKQAF